MLEKFVYVTGGLLTEQEESKNQTIGGVERFDIVKKVWEPLADLKVARQGHASCAMDDTVYVFCGCDS